MPIRTAAARASSGVKPERLTPSTYVRNRQMRRPLIARTRPARPRFGCPSSLTTDCRQTTGHAAHAQRPNSARPRTTRADERDVGASRYPKAAAEPATCTESVARRRCAIRVRRERIVVSCVAVHGVGGVCTRPRTSSLMRSGASNLGKLERGHAPTVTPDAQYAQIIDRMPAHPKCPTVATGVEQDLPNPPAARSQQVMTQ